MDLSVLYNINYGMYLLGVSDIRKPTGCIINTVTQITSEEPIISISINKNNYTYEVIKSTSAFSVSILSENIEPMLISRFGFYSGRDIDKFSGIRYEMAGGLPILKENCCGNLICEVVSIEEMGTHAVVFAKLIDTIKGEKTNPMTYSYYHKVLKGITSKYAPTYQSTEGNKGKYQCQICGYIHYRDINLESDDFRCPICGAAKDQFKLIE